MLKGACNEKQKKHPRVRGEDGRLCRTAENESETPPRARGRHFLPAKSPAKSGNTPACAGKTSDFRQWCGSIKKHPRVRGEDLAEIGGTDTYKETPPRARGRLNMVENITFVYRNTPACAGKTFLFAFDAMNVIETPPRARGRLNMGGNITFVYGNTPACAGKTGTYCWEPALIYNILINCQTTSCDFFSQIN